jgi:cold shock CspA family protein
MGRGAGHGSTKFARGELADVKTLVFVHFRALPRGLQEREGMRVCFEVTNDRKTGKPQANNVRLV